MARLRDVPKSIEIHFVPSEAAPSGVGELGVPSVAPADCECDFRERRESA